MNVCRYDNNADLCPSCHLCKKKYTQDTHTKLLPGHQQMKILPFTRDATGQIFGGEEGGWDMLLSKILYLNRFLAVMLINL